MIICDFLTLSSGQQMHYRMAGEGAPLLILHPSPQSSEAMGNAISAFSPMCRCFALDTPGYGLSDDMTQNEPVMGDYADVVVEAADALGIGSFLLYGAATGSQIGIEIAKRYPQRVKFLMLDSNGHVADEERERMLDGYFPDVAPRRDGGHLLTYWDMCKNLFFAFPWNSTRPQDRFNTPMPPVDVIQQTMLRYLQAGQDYAGAYHVAFHTEKRDHMADLTVPTVMTRWEGSLVLGLADALIKEGLPDCVELLHAGSGVEDRFAVQAKALQKAINDNPDLPKMEKVKPQLAPVLLHKAYRETSFGPLLVHTSSAGTGTPVLFLHAAGESSEQMAPLARDLVGKRPVIMVDLPGHGESRNAIDHDSLSLGSIAKITAEALSNTDLKNCDIVAKGLGGAVALQLCETVDADRIFIVDSLALGETDRPSQTALSADDIAPQMDGTHLIKIWNMVYDAAVAYSSRNGDEGRVMQRGDEMAPSILHQKTCDVLKCGAFWTTFKTIELGLNWSEQDNVTIDRLERLQDWLHENAE